MEYDNFIKTEKIPGYNELIESMETVAQESTLEQGISDIRQDISEIDFSALAKQGSNANISLTTMDSKLGDYVLIEQTEYPYALADLISRLV